MRSMLFLILLIPFFSSCTKEPSGQTEIILDYKVDGLDLTLTGNVTNDAHLITELIIDWGDGSNATVVKNGFDSIMESYKYETAGVFSLMAKAINNVGDTTLEQQEVTVSFKETTLDGIRNTIYKSAENEYLFLTLNLHTYQEDDQLEKLNMVIDVIGELDVDFITFQECAQNKFAELIDETIRQDNMAHLIVAGLQEKYGQSYNYIWDWSHYGWSVWEEGVAVLSKYPITSSDARYVSSSTSVNNIESRKVIYGACQLPGGEQVNLFSAHLHWRKSETDQEQNKQIKNLQAMVDEKGGINTYSFIGGDFNVNPTSDAPWSEGYETMIDNNNYIDAYLLANEDANNKPAKSEHHTVLGSFPGRIDYIFMKTNPDFSVVDSQIIFNRDVVGIVSDHYGVITKVKLGN